MPELFAQVILPLSLHDAYSYRVPEKWQHKIIPGQRVVVQFGAKKLYSALVLSVSDSAPENIEIKEIIQILDDEPVIFPENLQLWKWIADYYCCTMGDMLRAALPSGLKLESKTKIIYSGGEENYQLSEKETFILELIKKEAVTPDFLQKESGANFSYSALKSLLDKNIVQAEENIAGRYKPKTEIKVKFHPKIKTEADLQNAINSLKRARRQKEMTEFFFEKTGFSLNPKKADLTKSELLKQTGAGPSVFNGLVEKKILTIYSEQISRIEEGEAKQAGLNLLSSHQQQALDEIKAGFEKNQVTLIHGITASGKTEIYIHLIDEAVRQGKQVLYLLPEIALTAQIIERLQNVFGSKAGIYHSRLNNQERVEVWNKVLKFKKSPKEGYPIVLGARSALFLPFSNLGLIIVDEEHENSFKQFDPAPRYHARDMAVVMGKLNNANVLLGSATPSFESFHNAVTGKYALVNLMQRHFDMELPKIITADLALARKRKKMHSMLTPELFSLMNEALDNNEQIILFQNRRGYSPYIQCQSCGWIPKCKNCDVSLTYYKFRQRLNCHYCGYGTAMPAKCPECGSPEIKTRGFGTEKIEKELKPFFPGKRIERMDLDTTRTKNAFGKIIHNLKTRKTDILVGTQMVAKGLDFEHVNIVGILNADNLINFPDFRAHERAYQLISQVSGRAGRKHKQGNVVIQTTRPEHHLIDLIKRQDYIAAFETQMEERKMFKYPPYYRLIKLIVKHKKTENVNRVAREIANQLRKSKFLIVLGPEFPLVSRIQLWYHKEIWLKLHPGLPLSKTKKFIVQTIENVRKMPDNSSCVVNIDVDPF